MTKLAGKKALVTGASRGIGAAIAKVGWRRGADVGLYLFQLARRGRGDGRRDSRFGVRGEAIRADAGDGEAVRHAVGPRP